MKRIPLFPFLLLFFAVSAHAEFWQGQGSVGPGGNTYPHARASVTRNPKFVLYEPALPRPASAPLLIYISSKGAAMGNLHAGMFEHLARRGTIVLQAIFDERNGKPTPAEAAEASIRAGLAELAQTSRHVPRDSRGVAYAGWSSGGYMALYFANNSERLGIGKTLAYIGHDHEAVSFAPCKPCEKVPLYCDFPLNDLSGLGPRTLVVFTTTEETARLNYESFGQVYSYSDWNLLNHIDADRKNYLQFNSDAHGEELRLNRPGARLEAQARLAGDHLGVLGIPGIEVVIPAIVSPSLGSEFAVPVRVDPLDWNGYWKLTAAAIDCSFFNRNCDYVIGGGARVRDLGKWRDGTAIRPLSGPSQIPALGARSSCP